MTPEFYQPLNNYYTILQKNTLRPKDQLPNEKQLSPMKKGARSWLLGICWGWKTIHLSWVFWDLKFQTNKPQTTPSRWFQPKNMSQSFIISPKIGKKFELPPPKTLTHPVSPHVLFPQTCLTTAPKMARFQLALRHRGLFFHVAPLHYLSPNEKRAPGCFGVARGWNTIPIYFVQLGIYGVI